ncbi:BQ2448_116 [Microbotryum intermedium]|uniref:BQ2448_116 protein n=1 Tax=Microbotryum intermedium TaxID=269621 RepID=A0A238F4N1_9BASI|nr:BQ2448_116 [Microbotryum intermedium]
MNDMPYERGAGYVHHGSRALPRRVQNGGDALQQPSSSPSSSSALPASTSASSLLHGNGDGHGHGHASVVPPEIPDRSHRRAPSISKRTSYSRTPGSSIHLQSSGSALSASPEAPLTMRRMPKSAVHNDLASTARGSFDQSQSSYPITSPQSSTPKFGSPREYQADSPLTPTMASQTLPGGAPHRDRDRTPFATPDRSMYAHPSASTTNQVLSSAPSRSREASVSSESSSKPDITPRPLHEPPILMPSSVLDAAGPRSRLSYPTVHSSGSSIVSESYDDKSDADSAESYGWSGLDDPTLHHEPTRSPLFSEEASGSRLSISMLIEGGSTARLRTLSPSTSKSGTHRPTSIAKSDAVDGDLAAWWTSPGSNKRSSLMSLQSTDAEAVRTEAPAAVPEEIQNVQDSNSLGIAYIPTENTSPGARRSTYEPQRPSSARSRATTPDSVREDSPLRASGTMQAPIRVQESSPLPDPSLAPSFVEQLQISAKQQPPTLKRPVERPSMLGPKSSSSGSDELVIPPKSPNRQRSPSLRRGASSLSLSDAVGALSLASPTASTTIDTSPQVGGSPSSQAPFAERKAKRQVSAPAPRPQKSRHRASASLVGKHTFDPETKLLAPMSTQTSTDTAAPSNSKEFELGAADRVAARPNLTMLSPAEPRLPVGRGQLDEPPMSASDFAWSYGEFDEATPIENHQVSQGENAFTRSSHVRSPAGADEPTAMGLTSSGPPNPAALTPRLAILKRTPTRSESPKDSIKNSASLYSQLTDTIADAANLEHDLSLAENWTAAPGLAPFELSPLRSASSLRQIDRPASVAGLSDVNSARASSPGFSSEDVFHDATAEDGMMKDVRRSSTASDLSAVPAPAPISPLGLGGVKLDAKARAAAFVADLKRARAAASGSSNGDSPIPSSPLMSSPKTTPLLTSEPLGISSMSQESMTSPTSYGESHSPLEVLNFKGRSDSRAQELDVKPSSPVRASPTSGPASLATETPRALTPKVTIGEETPLSQPPAPPAQPLAPTFRSGSFSDRTPLAPSTAAVPSAPYDSPPLAPEPLPLSPPPSTLRRRRPLPSSLQIINDLKRTRTAGERANVYAMKIRELRKETSGIANWVGVVQHGHYEGMTSQTLSQLSRHSRDEGSSASFPARPDAMRARELPAASFTRQDLVPTVPFPGVLGAIHHSPSSSLPAISSPSSSSNSTARFSTSQLLSNTSLSLRPASAIKDKASFFTSLGRRGSRRESASAALPASPTAVAPPTQRLSVSAPFNGGPTTTAALTSAVPFSSVRAAGIVTGPRPIDGASQPTPGTNAGIPTVPASVPPANPAAATPSNEANKTSHESLIGTTNRTSFIYGGGQSVVLEEMDHRPESAGEEYDEEEDEETKEKVQRLVDILPYARPEQIRSALRRANGDDVLAISIFLSDDQD